MNRFKIVLALSLAGVAMLAAGNWISRADCLAAASPSPPGTLGGQSRPASQPDGPPEDLQYPNRNPRVLRSESGGTVFDPPAATPTTTPATGPAVKLPKPRTEGGMPLMEALRNRHTARQFSDRKLSDQTLSDLLWAACGVNREDGRRTAPTAMNRQEIDVYVARADGLWLYDHKGHALQPILDKDLRALTGTQGFVKDAPVNLIFVADFSRMGKGGAEADKVFLSAADTGYVSQNVYLFCAGEGLATVVRGLVDRPALAKAMGLRPDQRIILAQSVGYPPAAAASQPASALAGTESPHGQAISLVLTTQQKAIREMEKQAGSLHMVGREDSWWFDTTRRTWSVVRPFGPGIIDSTHMFTVRYAIDGNEAGAWSVDTRGRKVTPAAQERTPAKASHD